MADLFELDVELRWRDKETKVRTVSLPFQTVERIDLWEAQAHCAFARVLCWDIIGAGHLPRQHQRAHLSA